MNSVKKGLAVGFLAAAVAACGNSEAGENAFSCAKDTRSAIVTKDGKNVTLVLQEKPANSSNEELKTVFTSTQKADNANAQTRAAVRYCAGGAKPALAR